MKVEIIKIKKELIDHDERRGPILRRAVMSPKMYSAAMKENFDMDLKVDMTEETYELQKVTDGKSGEVQCFFVKVDDRKLFNQLLVITDGTVNRLIKERTQALEERAMSAAYREFRRIANLPWWKRLFNKF